MNDDHRPKTNPRSRSTFAACAVGFLLALTASAPGEIEVNVTRVGFPCIGHGTVIRHGTWTPVVVDLALLNQSAFDGTLRIAQLDNDGDECFDSAPVHLRADTGGTARRHLYALANPMRGQGRFSVELRDTEGEAVEVVSQGALMLQARPVPAPVPISHDSLFILSISNSTLGRVGDLIDAGQAATGQQTAYNREINIGHMSPRELPEQWFGLEAVDWILWDEARPEDLTEKQLAALLEWTRQGGMLLIFASRTANSIALTKPLAEVLPVKLGEVVNVDDLPSVRGKLLNAAGERGYDPPVPVVRCTAREGVRVIADEPLFSSDLITRCELGHGHIIFAGITQGDLFSSTGSAVEFYRQVLHLIPLADPQAGLPNSTSLFGNVISAVSFARSASLYLFVAAICSLAYFFAATFGTWSFLSSRNWRQHSWSAFAVAGLLASVLAVIIVNGMRGFGETLHQLSIVDVEAGEVYGRATTFFGLKTGTDKELDVWLPADAVSAGEPGPTNCFLRPVPGGNDPTEATGSPSYADPQEYRLVPASALVEDVPFRATLKQFEGRWEGRLDGRVTGQIAVRRGPQGSTFQDRRFTNDSYIVNELGVDLKDCYILHTLFDMDSSSRYDENIYAYPVGDIPGDGSRFMLAPACYDPSPDPKKVLKEMRKQTLARQQERWSGPFRSMIDSFATGGGSAAALGEEQKALLLLSTIGEMSPLQGRVMGLTTWSRDRLRGLDMREWLDDNTVILIGFAEDPGPVRLFHRRGDRSFRPCEPDARRSWTMYRVRIPAKVLDPPGRGSDEDENPYSLDNLDLD